MRSPCRSSSTHCAGSPGTTRGIAVIDAASPLLADGELTVSHQRPQQRITTPSGGGLGSGHTGDRALHRGCGWRAELGAQPCRAQAIRNRPRGHFPRSPFPPSLPQWPSHTQRHSRVGVLQRSHLLLITAAPAHRRLLVGPIIPHRLLCCDFDARLSVKADTMAVPVPSPMTAAAASLLSHPLPR